MARMQTSHADERRSKRGARLLLCLSLWPFLALADGPVSAVDLPSSSESEPPRLVSLYQGATDSAIALGITPVGVVDAWLEKPTYRYLRDALVDVAHVGLETQPNLEKVAWLAPDVIIASRFRHARVAPLLDAMATSVYANTVFDFKTTLTLVANASGHERQAQTLLARWEARVADFRQQIADRYGDDWPQKVAVVRFKSDHVRVYTDGFAGSILDELGFEQPESLASQSWGMKLASTENIPALDADVMFVLLEPGDAAIAENYQHWASHPLWQRLTAVQRGQVFEADPVSWMMGGGILAANAMLDDLYRYYRLAPADVQREPRCERSSQEQRTC